jgi:hypothetical protein
VIKLKTLAVISLLSPALAMAAEGLPSSMLVVPGIMTAAGERFASQCSDEAFAVAPSSQKLANRCDRLLARWHAEAAQRIARRANPRIEKIMVANTAEGAHLPFDTVAMLRSDPFAGFGSAR